MGRYRLELLTAYGQVRALLDVKPPLVAEYQKAVLDTFDMLEETIARAKREYAAMLRGESSEVKS